MSRYGGTALRIHLKPLLKLKKKILKCITFTPHPVVTDQLCYNTGILSFKKIVKHRIDLLINKLSNGNAPKPLQNVYPCNQNVHHHFTKQGHNFHFMRCNNECVYRTFVFRVFSYGIKLIQNININVSYARFKHLFKDFFSI